VFISRKQPVPSVFLTSPGWEHAWPTKAGLLVAENSGDGNARRRRERGFAVHLAARAHLRKHGSKNLKCRKQLSSQSSVCRLRGWVRPAFVTSVTCTPPFALPVRFERRKVSTLPKSKSPEAVFSRAPGMFCNSQPSVRDLPVFFLSDGNDARVLVKHHEARAGCALIDGSDVIFQGMRLNCRVAGCCAMGATGEWKSSIKTRLAVKRKKPLLAVAL
jgi:hypothetical protein